MAGRDVDVASTGNGIEDQSETEIESSGSAVRAMRRRQGVLGVGVGAPVSKNDNTTSLSSSSSSLAGRMSTRLRTFPVPSSATSDGGVAVSSSGDGDDCGVRVSERRSGRMTFSASRQSGDKDESDEVKDSGDATKKRRTSSLIFSKEKDDGGGRKCAKSNAASARSKNSDTDKTMVVDEKGPTSIKVKRKPLILLGEKPRGMYECDYCGSDITRAPRIRCADCPDFDLCLECFAVEDHHHMAKYKREEESQRRKEAARIAGLQYSQDVETSTSSAAAAGGGGGGGMEKGVKQKGRREGSRVVGSNNKETEKDEDDELGSYVGGIWVPYFRHTAKHRYIVADSTRYVMFPSFRGVRAAVAETADVDESSENAADTGKGGMVIEKDKEKMCETSFVSTKDEEAVASETMKESTLLEEDQCQLQAAMGIDEVAIGNDTVSAKVPRKLKLGETDKFEFVDRINLDANVHSKKNLENEYDLLEASEATKRENNAGTMESDAEKNKKNEGEAQFSNDDSNALSSMGNVNSKNVVVVVEDADISSTIDHGPKPQPRRYRVIDDAKNSWTAEEDLRLLDGILSCGLGNWPDIAEHVNGTTSEEGIGIGGGGATGGVNGEGGNLWLKTDKQCMERYLDDFMGRYGCILPPYTMIPEIERECGVDEKVASTWVPDITDGENAGVGTVSRKRPRRSVSSSILAGDELASGFKATKFRAMPTEELGECTGIWPHPYIPPIEGVKMGDEVGRDLWYRSEQYFIRQTASAATAEEAEAFRKEFIERRAEHQLGYEAKVLPPRLEDMKQLPGAELAGYMPRRGEFDMEWDNDAEKMISEMEFTSDDTDADRELKLEVIRIFNTKLDEREKRKKFIIDRGLLNYRENQENMWRMAPDERQLVQRMRIFARYQTREEHEAFLAKIIEAKRLRKEISKLQMYRRMGISSLADAEKYEMDKARRELHRIAWMKKEEEKRKAAEEAARAVKENATSLGIIPPVLTQPSVPISQLEGAVNIEMNQSLQLWRQFMRPKDSGSEMCDVEKMATNFVLKDEPGFELLTKKEVGLCTRLRLLPQTYLDVKTALISETIAKGIWNPTEGGGQKQNRSIFKVDVAQRESIIDFVLESGWLPTRPR